MRAARAGEHGLVEFRVLREGSRAKSRVTHLDSREQSLASYQDLLETVPWDAALERKSAQET